MLRKLTRTLVGVDVANFVVSAVAVTQAVDLEASDADVGRISQKSSRASTCGCMIVHVANRICAAPYTQARVRTFPLATRQAVSAVRVVRASVGKTTTRLPERIPDSPLGTAASVRAQGVDALGARMARTVLTLVHVDAVVFGHREAAGAATLAGKADLVGLAV